MFLRALFSAFPFSFRQLFYAIFFIFSLNSLVLKASAFASIAHEFYISALAIIKMLLRNATDEETASDGVENERIDTMGKERETANYEESCTTRQGGSERGVESGSI